MFPLARRIYRASPGTLAGLLFLIPAAPLWVAPAWAQAGFNGPGRYTIVNAGSGKVLDLDRNDGITVIQFDSRSTDNQTWEVQPGFNGLWTIRNLMNGNALDASGQAKGGTVRGAAFTAANSQLWRIDTASGRYAVLVAGNSGVLDVPNASRRDGVRLHTWERNEGDAQQWLFRQVAGTAFGGSLAGNSSNAGMVSSAGFNVPGRYEIVSLNSGKVLDMDSNDRSTVMQFDARHTNNQIWEIRSAGANLYYVVNTMNGNALEALSAGSGAQVRATPFQGLETQQWRIQPSGDGFLFISRYGNVLDVPNANRDNGVRLQLWERNDTKAQQWRIAGAAGGGSGSIMGSDAAGVSPLTPNRGDTGTTLVPENGLSGSYSSPRGGGQSRLSQGEAVDACQAAIRSKLANEFGNARAIFRSTETATVSGAQLAVRGAGNVAGGPANGFQYQCVVNVRAGKVMSATYR